MGFFLLLLASSMTVYFIVRFVKCLQAKLNGKDLPAEEDCVKFVSGFTAREDAVLVPVGPPMVEIDIRDMSRTISVTKTVFDQSYIEPQQVPGTGFWLYRKFVLTFKPTEEQLKLLR